MNGTLRYFKKFTIYLVKIFEILENEYKKNLILEKYLLYTVVENMVCFSIFFIHYSHEAF